MANRSHLAAPRYELPEGYVDAIGHDDALIKSQPNVLPVRLDPAPATLTKAQLAARVSERTGVPKAQANRVVGAVFAEMAAALQTGAKVRVNGVGTLKFDVAKFEALTGGKPKHGRGAAAAKAKYVAARKRKRAAEKSVAEFQPAAVLRDAAKRSTT